jgi:hypothetical protein
VVLDQETGKLLVLNCLGQVVEIEFDGETIWWREQLPFGEA